MIARRLAAALLLVATSGVATNLRAQPDPAPTADEEAGPPAEPEKSPAEILFERGLEDMLAGRLAQACPALAQSYRMDPLPGALFTLAECENKWGKLTRAQTHYRDYVTRVERMAADQRDRQQQRLDVARAQLEALEPRVPLLTLRLQEGSPADAVVSLDGEALVAATLGVAMPLDPGEHRVTVVATGRKPSELLLSLSEGDRTEQTVSVGADEDVPPPPPPPPPSGLHPMQIGALVAGGVGVVGLAVGTVSGIIALGHKSTIDEQCVDAACTPEGLDAVDSGQLAGNISTVGFVVGALGAAAGATLWFLAPSGDEPTAGWNLQLSGVPPVASASSAPTGILVGLTRAW